jgi:hypothetical protein
LFNLIIFDQVDNYAIENKLLNDNIKKVLKTIKNYLKAIHFIFGIK